MSFLIGIVVGIVIAAVVITIAILRDFKDCSLNNDNMKKDSIALSPKHGVNPSVCNCICCGNSYGVALLGKLKGDKEAPKEIYEGLCPDCEGVIKQGGVMIIEVKDGETGDKPYRTGRVVGVSKEFKKRNHINSSICYMEHSHFDKLFSPVEFD